jgi:hypothetical protein
MTLQFAPLRIALAFLTLLLATGAPVLGAVERLSLSEPVAELERRLSTPPSVPPQPGVRSPRGARPEIAPYALILDRDSLDPKSTDALLTAIADLRAAGGRVVAIRPKTPAPSAGKPIDGGVAVLALACDALAFESGATIAGATADWCTSATKRTELAEKLGPGPSGALSRKAFEILAKAAVIRSSDAIAAVGAAGSSDNASRNA